MTCAVVLGAGFGGLVVAAALRVHADEVVLIERNHLHGFTASVLAFR